MLCIYPTWLVVRDHTPVEAVDVPKDAHVTEPALEQVVTLEDKERFAKGKTEAQNV